MSLFYCKKCKRKSCLKTGRPCKKVEKLLPKDETGRLHGEFNLSSNYMDEAYSKELDGDVTDLRNVRRRSF